MSMDLSAKTIFVLVHTNDMLTPIGHDIIMDVKKSVPANPLVYSKTLWSATVESFLEYIRIVFDVFGDEKEIGLVVVDNKERICIQPDDKSSQNWRSWMKMLAEIGPPQNAFQSLTGDGVPGYKSILSLISSTKVESLGYGRVIVLGYNMSEYVAVWNEEIQQNLTYGTEGNPSIHSSEWYFIDVHSMTDNIATDESPILINGSSERHQIFRQSCQANKELHKSLMWLCEQHYNLTCILVQNIPMKEDTTNTQSAMYGVELVMPKVALLHMEEAALLPLVTMPHRPHCGFSSCIGIRWVTPRPMQDIDYYNTRSVHKVTTADVCNRASCCLANFVLEGRSVVLEIDPSLLPNSVPGVPDRPQELLLLTSHGGLLYIHGLIAHPDPYLPTHSTAISSAVTGGTGGASSASSGESNNGTACAAPAFFPCFSDLSYKKLANKLRINDFCQLILSTRLAPSSTTSSGSVEMKVHTRYWPELITDTLIFNKPLMGKVLEMLMRKKLEFSEKSNCIGFLHQLVSDQCQTDKAATKKQNIENKTFKTELELLLTMYKDRSVSHKEILETFDVFSNNVSSLINLEELLKPSPNNVTENTYSGLSKMDALLMKGGYGLRNILNNDKDNEKSNQMLNGKRSNSTDINTVGNGNNQSGSVTKNRQIPSPVSKKPIQGSFTLREVLNNVASGYSSSKRRRFDGELSAVDNMTELYLNSLQIPSTGGATATTVTAGGAVTLSTSASSLPVTSGSSVINGNVTVNGGESCSSLGIGGSNVVTTSTSGLVDPRKEQ